MDRTTKRKIYTRAGDKGYTSTLGSARNVSKAHLRIEVCGTLDELNAFIGFAISALKQYEQLTDIVKKCLRIQHELFDLGAQLLSYPIATQETWSIVSANDVKILEEEIDEMDLQLPELHNFILPGGGEAAARLHVSRTICRRLERVLVRLSELIKFDEIIIVYINRLSDWLFMTARFVASTLKQNEIIWHGVS